MRYDTENTCHCGADYQGSDHCPECGCEQYETGDCGHTVTDVTDVTDARIVSIRRAVDVAERNAESEAERRRIAAIRHAVEDAS